MDAGAAAARRQEEAQAGPRAHEAAASAASAAATPPTAPSAGRRPLFFQLYPPRTPTGGLDREYTRAALRHAECHGCTAVFVTVDTQVDGNRERTYKSAPWLADVGAQLGAMPHVVTLQQAAGVPARHPGMCSVMGWADVSWIRSITGMKVVVKGVMTAEDARIATEHCDAIVVSNHGGRQLDGCDATAHVLHECVQAADGKIEVFVDGGVRRGKDVFRALALGASAVLIGRPAAYGLAAGGEHGVARVLELLREELATVMQLCGCAAVRDISEAHVRRKKNGEA